MSTMSRAIVGGFVIALAGVGYLQAAWLPEASPAALSAPSVSSQTQAASPVLPAASPQRALLDRYCVTCHNEKLRTAGLTLDSIDVAHVGAGAAVWEKVVGKLRMSAMPPPGRPRPDKATYDAFAAWLETELDRAAAANPNPGRPTVHRLNRAEYGNAIRDLLALEVDVRSLLPNDESGYGFDNIADVLTVTPALLERYLVAAQKISRLAIGDPTMRPAATTHTVSPFLVQWVHMNDDLPFGSRGGTVVRHYFPLDGEYVIKVNLRRNWSSPVIRGLEHREQIDLRLDDARVTLFTVGGECVGSKEPRCVKMDTGILFTSEYEATADDPLFVRVRVKAGMRQVSVAFLPRSAAATEGAEPEFLPHTHSISNALAGEPMSVDSVKIEGPVDVGRPGDTVSRQRIFVCRPTGVQDEEACAQQILATLARRAYRRPVTNEDVATLLGFYQIGRSKGGFETGIQFALERLLASPNFLLRVERDPADATPGAPYRISDLELASRLSFFLWSSIPDDELLDVAARGQLSDARILEQQVRRLLGDARARTALVNNFAGQWLYLRNLQAMSPDARMYPDFDDTLREAFQLETELFLESQLREDRSVLELLTANYTFVNERLAKFYGIPRVYGAHFRRVTLPDANRAGLLGHGSILTVTSYSTRTSPVVRGKWVLENILGAPPPPPPPNVPPLKEPGEAGAPPATMRQRMEQHRQNPVCAACHVRMDPLGFALENFSGIGKWRTHEAGIPIDAAGIMANGTKVEGPAQLRMALLNYRGEFVRTVTEKLLTYALGRGVEYYDMPAIRTIIRDAAASDYRWSSLVLGIVKSTPFQMRRAQEPVSAGQ